MEKIADEFEKYAHDENKQGRMVKPLFTSAEEHDGVDASGWCLKMARKWRRLAVKKRKKLQTQIIPKTTKAQT